MTYIRRGESSGKISEENRDRRSGCDSATRPDGKGRESTSNNNHFDPHTNPSDAMPERSEGPLGLSSVARRTGRKGGEPTGRTNSIQELLIKLASLKRVQGNLEHSQSLEMDLEEGESLRNRTPFIR